jgi:hypothetical protein
MMSTLDVVVREATRNINSEGAAPSTGRETCVLHIDVETRSRLNIRQVSTKRYAQDASTEVLCIAYTIDDGPVTSLTPGALPEDIAQFLANPDGRIAAHNCKFEHLI